MSFLRCGKYADVNAPERGVRRGDDFLAPCEFNAALALRAALYAGREPLRAGVLVRQNILRNPAGKQARAQFTGTVGAAARDAQRGEQRDRDDGEGDQHLDQRKAIAPAVVRINHCVSPAPATHVLRLSASPSP